MISMVDSKHRVIWPASCFVICYGVFLYFYITGNWLYISVPGLMPPFADFLFILAGSDCAAMGINIVVENPCDPWGRAHNYGLLWLEIGRLGLTRDDITWLALTINAIFLSIAAIVISPSTLLQSVVTIFFLVSPAVMLGLERANADLLIFSLLALSFYMIYSSNLFLITFGCLIILFAGILKLYPVVILPVLIFYYSASRIKFALLMTTLFLFILYIFLNWHDVAHLIGVIPNITWYYSMGGELLFSRLGYELTDSTRNATYLMGFGAILAGIIWGCRLTVTQHDPVRHNGENDWTGMLYLSGAVLVVFSFVIKNSFDYRNIFFLFLLPLLFRLVFTPGIDGQRKKIASGIVVVYGFLFWAEFFVSLFHTITLSGFYIRIIESILNWLIVVPVVMLAMQVAVTHSDYSWLMRIVVKPVQKIFTKNPETLNHE